MAAINGDLTRVMQLVQSGVSVNTKHNGGRTALHWSSYKGHLKLVRYLVEQAGANINVKSTYSEASPLHDAIEGGHLTVVQYLVEHGADIDAKNSHGKIALDVARCHRSNEAPMIVQYLEQQKQQHGDRATIIQELELEQQSWIDVNDLKKATHCSTRAELDIAISKLEKQISELSQALTSTELKKRFKLEQQLSKLTSFQVQMPTLDHLREWVMRLQTEIQRNKDNTEMAIALAEHVEQILPRLQMEKEAAASSKELLGRIPPNKTSTTPGPASQSARMLLEEGNAMSSTNPYAVPRQDAVAWSNNQTSRAAPSQSTTSFVVEGEEEEIVCTSRNFSSATDIPIARAVPYGSDHVTTTAPPPPPQQPESNCCSVL